MTKKSEKIGVIVEAKFNKRPSEASNQIIERNYLQGLPNANYIKKMILIGLNIAKGKKTEFTLQIESG